MSAIGRPNLRQKVVNLWCSLFFCVCSKQGRFYVGAGGGGGALGRGALPPHVHLLPLPLPDSKDHSSAYRMSN